MAAVVEAVLAARSTVKIDDQLEVVVSRPSNGFGQVRKLTLDIGFAWADFKRPITDGESDVIEASSGDGGKIGLSNPRVPVGG